MGQGGGILKGTGTSAISEAWGLAWHSVEVREALCPVHFGSCHTVGTRTDAQGKGSGCPAAAGPGTPSRPLPCDLWWLRCSHPPLPLSPCSVHAHAWQRPFAKTLTGGRMLSSGVHLNCCDRFILWQFPQIRCRLAMPAGVNVGQL